MFSKKIFQNEKYHRITFNMLDTVVFSYICYLSLAQPVSPYVEPSSIADFVHLFLYIMCVNVLKTCAYLHCIENDDESTSIVEIL